MCAILLIIKCIIIAFGVILLFLMWWLPNRFERRRNHGGAVFGSGGESLREALGYILTAFLILAAMAGVSSILAFQEKGVTSVILGVITLILFSIGILRSVYLSLIRPLSGIRPTPNQIYWVLRLLLLGLAFTMFTLASTI